MRAVFFSFVVLVLGFLPSPCLWAQDEESEAQTKNEADEETAYNVKLFSSLMARGTRPLSVVRPKGFYLGANLSLVGLPRNASRGMAEVAQKLPLVPLPALAMDVSSGNSQDSVSLFYFSLSPLPGTKASFSNFAYGHDSFMSSGRSGVLGIKMAYSNIEVEREVILASEKALQSLSYSGYSGLVTLSRQPGGKGEGSMVGKNPGISWIPYIGAGYWAFRSHLQVDFSNVDLVVSHESAFSNLGMGFCAGYAEACFTTDLTIDAELGAVIMGTIVLRR